MKLYGPRTDLSALAQAIVQEDLQALDAEYAKGWNIHTTMDIAQHVHELPLTLALVENKVRVINWLLERQVKLNHKDAPAMVSAMWRCNEQTLSKLLAHGADINAADRVGKTAMTVLLYVKRPKLIPFLVAQGYDLAGDGRSLRQAVFGRQYQAVELLLAHGANVNLHTKDMVHPDNPCAVAVAAGNNDLKIVRLLIEHGADVSRADIYGDRAYYAAIKNKNTEMAELIAAHEPAEWHSPAAKLAALASYAIPQALLDIICSGKRHMDFASDSQVRYIVFKSITELKATTWRKKVFVDLLSEVDNYSEGGFLVCIPQKTAWLLPITNTAAFASWASQKPLCKTPAPLWTNCWIRSEANSLCRCC